MNPIQDVPETDSIYQEFDQAWGSNRKRKRQRNRVGRIAALVNDYWAKQGKQMVSNQVACGAFGQSQDEAVREDCKQHVKGCIGVIEGYILWWLISWIATRILNNLIKQVVEDRNRPQ